MQRFDIVAAQNIARNLQRISPRDYERLMQRLNRRRQNLGTAQPEQQNSTGFWRSVLDFGRDALTEIATFRLQEEGARRQQRAFNEQAQAELERQALLAAQAESAAMELRAQMDLQRQRIELERAAEAAKNRFDLSMLVVLGLGGLLAYRLLA